MVVADLPVPWLYGLYGYMVIYQVMLGVRVMGRDGYNHINHYVTIVYNITVYAFIAVGSSCHDCSHCSAINHRDYPFILPFILI